MAFTAVGRGRDRLGPALRLLADVDCDYLVVVDAVVAVVLLVRRTVRTRNRVSVLVEQTMSGSRLISRLSSRGWVGGWGPH